MSYSSPHCVVHHASIPWMYTVTGMGTIMHPVTLEWLKVSILMVTVNVCIPCISGMSARSCKLIM